MACRRARRARAPAAAAVFVALQGAQTGGSLDQPLFAVPVKAVKIKQSSR